MKPGSLLLVKVIRVTTQGRPEATARGVDVMSPYAQGRAVRHFFNNRRGNYEMSKHVGGCLAWNVYEGPL